MFFRSYRVFRQNTFSVRAITYLDERSLRAAVISPQLFDVRWEGDPLLVPESFKTPSSTLAEQPMKFQILKSQQRSRRNKVTLQASAVVESLEVRSLLTDVFLTGPVAGAPPVTNDATPTISWNEDTAADTYDLWITDAEQRTPVLIQRGITGNSFTPANDLNLGLTRVWVRSNYSNGSSPWSPPTLFVVKVTPTVTGPVNSTSTESGKLNDTTPTIEWTSPPGAVRFEVFFKDLTTLYAKTIRLNVTPLPANLPVQDAKGVALLDGTGKLLDADGETQLKPQTSSTYSYEIPEELPMGRYQVFVRSLDDGGNYSEWSGNGNAGFEFEVAPQVKILRPSAPTFQTSSAVEVSVNGTPTSGSYTISLTTYGLSGRTLTTTALPYDATLLQVQAAVRNLSGFGSTVVTTTGLSPNLTHLLSLPAGIGKVTASVTGSLNSGTVSARTTSAQKVLLEWEPVEGATHYTVEVRSASGKGLYYSPNLTTTSYQIPNLLSVGDYVFWVQAVRRHQVTEIKLTGTPTSGNYRIQLTATGKDGKTKTQQTALISYDATAAQIKAAVVSLEGFEKADVFSQGAAPNLTHLLQIPQYYGAATVNVVGSISPGTLTDTSFKKLDNTIGRERVVGLWSAASYFSTIQDPVVTAPVGVPSNTPGQRLVTEVRPTIEWTPIDKAARYEVWVNVSTGTQPYLTTTSSTSSYKFEQDIMPGKYAVWVRAVSTTGVLTGWGQAYEFEATGGAPVILSPAAGTSVSPIPTVTWTSVADAASYEIWFAWIGQDFTYIQESAITTTNYAPASPLPTGSYRVWVRAVRSDGSFLPWSSEATFSVAMNDAKQIGDEIPALLTSLLSTVDQLAAEDVAEIPARQHFEIDSTEAPHEGSRVPPESIAILPAQGTMPAMSAETESLIQQLAERCTTEEWWMPQGSGA